MRRGGGRSDHSREEQGSTTRDDDPLVGPGNCSCRVDVHFNVEPVFAVVHGAPAQSKNIPKLCFKMFLPQGHCRDETGHPQRVLFPTLPSVPHTPSLYIGVVLYI